jgi:hypothetical protein
MFGVETGLRLPLITEMILFNMVGQVGYVLDNILLLLLLLHNYSYKTQAIQNTALLGAGQQAAQDF